MQRAAGDRHTCASGVRSEYVEPKRDMGDVMSPSDTASLHELLQLATLVEFCRSRLQESTAKLEALKRMRAKKLRIDDARGNDVLPVRIKASEQEVFELINKLARAQADLGLARMSNAEAVIQNPALSAKQRSP